MNFKLENKVIYLLSPNHWGDMHISKHHYAKELAKKNKVYFISPPNKNNRSFEEEEVLQNLFVIRYYPIFRGKSILPTSLFNHLVKLQIWFLSKKIGLKPDVLWSFTSTLYYHLAWFKAQFTIFHPMDQLNTIESVNIAKEADVIFSCSQFIIGEMKDIFKPKFLIGHGVSPSFTDYHFPLETPQSQLNIGYVGNLFIQNLDRKTIQLLILANPSIHFHFFGATQPNESNISAWIRKESLDFVEFLLNTSNVTCHGVIPSEKLPEHIKCMDAFFLCYKSTPENLITNSHKILEYMSTGKIIISTYVHEYQNSTLIEMCENSSNENFLNLFDKVVSNLDYFNSFEHQLKRKKYVEEHSYSSNIALIEVIINKNNLS